MFCMSDKEKLEQMGALAEEISGLRGKLGTSMSVLIVRNWPINMRGQTSFKSMLKTESF